MVFTMQKYSWNSCETSGGPIIPLLEVIEVAYLFEPFKVVGPA